jgi:hypothetical protein
MYIIDTRSNNVKSLRTGDVDFDIPSQNSRATRTCQHSGTSYQESCSLRFGSLCFSIASLLATASLAKEHKILPLENTLDVPVGEYRENRQKAT